MKMGETIGILHSLALTYVKYANMEGFHRDSHIYYSLPKAHYARNFPDYAGKCFMLSNPYYAKNYAGII